MILVFFGLAACGQNVSEPATRAASEAPAESAPALPPGHPAPSSQPSVVPPPPGSGGGNAGLTWDAPESWIAETPTSAMRKAQYRVEGPAGSAECVVYYFGPGQGGDVASNVQRWAGQFQTPDGTTPEARTREIEVAGRKATLVEVEGTYGAGAMMGGAPQEPSPGFMLLGAIVEGPDANWFFKLTGPAGTVEAAREGFEGMVRSLRGGEGEAPAGQPSV